MALIKQIILPNGIETNYHRIQSISKMENTLNVIVVSYTNKYYRQQAIINYVHSETYTFELDTSEVSFELTYNLLKNNTIFENAEDD